MQKLQITFESESGSRLEGLARYDEQGDYVPLGSFIAHKKQTKTLRFALRRCAFLRVKIRGKGFSKIYAITYFFEQGSEK